MPRPLPRHLRDLLSPHPGWVALAAAVALTAVGVVAVDTVAGTHPAVPPDAASKQLRFWLPAALVVGVLCTLPHPRRVGESAWALAVVSLGLLIFVILPFAPRSIVPVINGSTAWIDLGPMNFQPSEMAKVSFVLALAWYLRYRDSYRRLTGLLVPFAIMLVPVGLILKEPDLGQAMVFGPTLFIILAAAGAKLRHMGALLGIGLLVIALSIAVVRFDPPHARHGGAWDMAHVLAPHQERRIAAMMWPERYADREAFQPLVAQRLAGAGGLVGVGRRRSGTLVRYNRLPEPHNDMIFAVIVNRWGLAGGLGVIALYLVLVLSLTAAAARKGDPFARLACVGFAGMIFTQATINIGMTLGLMPITGITLPLVSYGGSSLLFTYAMIGLAVNFASRRPLPLTRSTFEFDDPMGVERS